MPLPWVWVIGVVAVVRGDDDCGLERGNEAMAVTSLLSLRLLLLLLLLLSFWLLSLSLSIFFSFSLLVSQTELGGLSGFGFALLNETRVRWWTTFLLVLLDGDWDED